MSTNKYATAILATHLLAAAACATPIVNVSTGAAYDGSLIAFNSLDHDWSLTFAPANVGLGSASVVAPARADFTNLEPLARWISPSPEMSADDAPWGYYTYEMQFAVRLDLFSGLSIVGQYAADNRLIDMRLNGHTFFVGPNVSGASCAPTGCREFESPGAPISFSMTDQSLFVNGLNALQVTIENQGPTFGNPTSFALAGAVNGTPIPEPGSIALLGVGLTALRARRHRQLQT